MSDSTEDGPENATTQTSTDTRWSQVTQRHYKPEGPRELTTAVIYAIAEAEYVSPSEIKSPPLYEWVDVAAVNDALFETNGSDGSPEGSVEFRYTNYFVNVRSDGWIRVFEPTDSGRS